MWNYQNRLRLDFTVKTKMKKFGALYRLFHPDVQGMELYYRKLKCLPLVAICENIFLAPIRFSPLYTETNPIIKAKIQKDI